jgi:ubiquinone/menaquinone biosynthesis C-methylase UbiE
MSQPEQLEQWQLEQSSAEAYERYLVPLLFAPGAQFLIELAGLGAGEWALDVACGTGIVARTAASRVGASGKVAGLDKNESMLEVARQASSEMHPAIEWRKGNASDIPFPEAAFDVVFCQQGLQFFPDQSAALREIHRVLAPNGRLSLSVLRSIKYNPGYGLLAEILERHLGPDAGMMMRSPFPALSRDELRELITGAGFREVRIILGIGPVRYPSVQALFQYEAASSPLASSLLSLEDRVHKALIHDLGEALQVYTDDQGIVFPAETYLAVARR